MDDDWLDKVRPGAKMRGIQQKYVYFFAYPESLMSVSPIPCIGIEKPSRLDDRKVLWTDVSADID